MDSLKPDLLGCPRRKRLQSWPAAMSRTLSPVRFESKSCGNAPISCNFQSNPSRFLYTSDCVAEREGFELSVPFLKPARACTARELHPPSFRGLSRHYLTIATSHVWRFQRPSEAPEIRKVVKLRRNRVNLGILIE